MNVSTPAGGEALRTVSLAVATMTTGFTASVFMHWSNTIMPALGEVDDRGEQRRTLMWIAAAPGCYLVALMITLGVHKPLNQTLRAPGELAADSDVAAARTRLDEARWTAWNTARAAASTVAFGCLTWALAGSRRWGSTAL